MALYCSPKYQTSSNGEYFLLIMFQIQVNYRENVRQFYINEISWNCLDGCRQTVWRFLNNVPSICSKGNRMSHLL